MMRFETSWPPLLIHNINYDLAFALVDMLKTEWPNLSQQQRTTRYMDHCHVNDVIGSTIDAVQDQILDPTMPVMDFIDKLLGPVDEFIISQLIIKWRENVWRNAIHLLEANEDSSLHRLLNHVERETLEIDELIWPKTIFFLSSRQSQAGI